jgi:CelD/BcsL family acetyltransferase involved in cellulose biosynthesis
MSDVLRYAALPDACGAAGIALREAGVATTIRVERVRAAAYAAWGEAFDNLARRDPAANPFMAPAMVTARRGRIPDDDIVVLAAWRESGGWCDSTAGHDLVGLWLLARRRDAWSGFLPTLQTPLAPRHDASSAPVLDAAYAQAALTALVDAAFTMPGLPRMIRASAWPEALNALLPPHVSIATAERWSRSVLTPDAAQTLWEQPKVRKRLKQERGLQRAGQLDHLILRGGQAQRGITIFLALEASGWKGAAGTALARHEADRADLEAVFEAFAAADRLCVDVLTLDGAPIAAGVQLEAGEGQLFWRTAYDERHARHSPGVMLDLAVTRRILQAGRPALDSGMGPFTNPDSQIWPGRRQLCAATLSPEGHRSAGIVAAGGRLRLALRRWKHGRTG